MLIRNSHAAAQGLPVFRCAVAPLREKYSFDTKENYLPDVNQHQREHDRRRRDVHGNPEAQQPMERQ